jgi:hypothetical protein
MRGVLKLLLAGMRSVWWKLTRAPQPYRAKFTRFVREQDGEVEDDFMVCVAPILARDSRVKRGYLARVVYEEAREEHVALCLVARAVDESLVREVGSVFRSMFGRDQHLDVLFVRAEQEAELAAVCRPFFNSLEA